MSGRVRGASGVVLLLFGVVLARLGTTDLLLRYVQPRARWPVLAAAVVLVLLGSVSLAATRSQVGHRHGAGSRVAWLALLPVGIVLLVGPPALGAYTARRQFRPPSPSGEVWPALPRSRSPVPVAVSSFLLRSLDRGGRTLRGRTVSLLGFVSGTTPGGFVLTRLVITCCAADAQPFDVAVQAATPAPATNRWVRVIGGYAGRSPDDIPVLRADAVQLTSAPSRPFE